MILNKPHSGLLSDSLAEVLKVLNQMTPGRTGRTIAAGCAGVSVAQTNNVLRSLESIGVVTTESVPPAKRYFLNREHLLTAPLLEIISAGQLGYDFLQSRLVGIKGLAKAIVFGSAAREEARTDSDIDLLLVFDSEPSDQISELVSKIAFEFEAKTGLELNVVTKKMSEVTPKLIENSAFLRNVELEGRSLIGGGLINKERPNGAAPGSKIT